MNGMKNSIAFKSIVFVVLQLIIFALLVSTSGFEVFSDTMNAQYSEQAFRIAKAAALAIDADRLNEYLAEGGDDPEYQETWVRLDQICNGTGLTFVYVIQPDLTDYGHITFIFSTVNRNTEYTPYEVGHVVETTNDEYREKYWLLYNGESEQELLILNSRSFDPANYHITAMVPLKGTEQRTEGILCVQRQTKELTLMKRTYLRNVLLTLFAVTAITLAVEGLYLNRNLIRPIRKITGEASRFARENVTAGQKLTDEFRSEDEIGLLADSIDQMEEQIVSYVEHLQQATVERERMTAELNIAKQIQAGMLPQVFPPFPEKKEFEIYASMTPAREVGGDFYDFFLTDEDHLALVIADVSGKGIPAALFMARAKTLIKNQTLSGDSPAEVLCHVNNQLCDANDAEMFITVWMAIIELSTGKGVAANAGHEHPVLCRRGGNFELVIYRHSLAVAAMEDVRFREHGFKLYPGDTVFVYTDGIPEATDSANELYGTDRLLEALNSDPGAGPEALMQTVRESVDRFVGDAPQFDDMTMLCLRYLGPEPRKDTGPDTAEGRTGS